MRDEKAAYYQCPGTDEPQDAYKLVAEGAKKLMRNPEWMRVEFEKRSNPSPQEQETGQGRPVG